MNQKNKKVVALIMCMAVLMTTTVVSSKNVALAAKKPKLSMTKKTLTVGKSTTMKVKKNGTKTIKKTKWSTSNKKVAAISKKKKMSVKITAKKKGTATIKAVIKYCRKGSKKVRTIKKSCKVTVKTAVKNVKDSNVTTATTKYSSLYKLAEKHGFKFGTVINYNYLSDPYYKKLAAYHFNSVTAGNEFKAYSLLDQSASQKSADGMPVMNYTQADAIIEYAKANGISMRGHTLVWDAYMKDWFFREGYDTTKGYVTTEVMKKRLQYYINEVLTHFEKKYPGVIYCWDVVNEAVADSTNEYQSGDARHIRKTRNGTTNMFYKLIGTDYVEYAFKCAKDSIDSLGSSIKLYYNDYNCFYDEKRAAITELVKSINAYDKDANGNARKLCDGIGMQGYIGGYGHQEGCMNDSDITKVKTSIQKYAELGFEVQLTEMAVRNYENDSATVEQHAEFYEKLFKAFVEINSGTTKPLVAVSIWGMFDTPSAASSSYGFSMNGPYCGLFNENYGVKSAFIKVHNVLK